MDTNKRVVMEKLIEKAGNTIAGVTFIVCLTWVVVTIICR